MVTADMEQKAADLASAAVGEYLDGIGKTDLAAMTAEEWQGFILHTHRSVSAQVSILCDQDTPF